MNLLPRNASTLDRVVRLVAGLALVAMLVVVAGPARWLGLLGFVLVGTGLVGSCPIYTLLGVSTCPAELGAARR